MFLLFENVKSNSDVKLNPMNTSRAWAIEQSMLEIYFLLVRRIKGIGLSLNDFWKLDTWTTSKLYCLELEILEEEASTTSEDEIHDDENVRDLYGEMFGES